MVFSIKDRPNSHFVLPKCTYLAVGRTVEMKGGQDGWSEVHGTFRNASPPQSSFLGDQQLRVCGECPEQWEITAFRVSIWANFTSQGTSTQDYQRIKPKWTANGATRDENAQDGQIGSEDTEEKHACMLHTLVILPLSGLFLIFWQNDLNQTTVTSFFRGLYIIHKSN